MKAVSFLLGLALLFQAGCSGEELDLAVVALVGEHPVSRDLMEENFKNILGEETYRAAPDILSQLLDRYLDEELIYLYAKESMPGDHTDKARSSLITEFLVDVCSKLPDPEEKEVEEYYATFKNRYRIGKTVVFQMILVEEEAKAEEIIEKLGQGEEFGDLAKRQSRSPNAKQGGRVGPVELQRLPRNIQDVLKELEEEKVSKVVEVPYGFLLFKVVKIIPAGDLTFEEVYDDIVRHFREEACVEYQQGLIKELERKENIWIYTHHLPFPYSGKYPSWQ